MLSDDQLSVFRQTLAPFGILTYASISMHLFLWLLVIALPRGKATILATQ